MTSHKIRQGEMLYKYKGDYEKIAMGLLSFIPDLKEIANLQTEIEWYEGDTDRILYLWKNENGDFTGIVGTEINDDFIMVRHISVTPAERNQGVSFLMLDELAALYPEKKLMGNLEASSLITKWEQHDEA